MDTLSPLYSNLTGLKLSFSLEIDLSISCGSRAEAATY